MVEEEVARQKPHILAFPWPAQGHINPMIQLCNHLASKGLKITLIITSTTSKSQTAQIKATNLIQIECISDGSDRENEKNPKDIETYFKHFREAISQSLPQLIDKLNTSPSRVYTGTTEENPVLSHHQSPTFLVYDSIMPWALDIAHEKGLLGASLFTQSCSVCAIYNHCQQENFKNVCEDGVLSLSSLPIILGKDDMPSFSYFKESSYIIQNLLTDQFSNIERVDWIFFNTFDKLEDKVVKWMASQWPVKTVGPTFLSPHLNNQPTTQNHAKIDLFTPNSEACMNWLNTKDNNSVIYVSSGSSVSLEQEQIEEIAYGLINSNHYFLWVVRESEESKLPKTFQSESSDKGLIVQWCPQLDILAHKSVACFVTHCGWNSMLEALSLGVPMICMPQWVDQTTNAKFVEDVWEIGVRFKVGESGIITRDEVETCVKQVMEEERLNVLKRNALRWKELAKEAVNDGGTSDRNIREFVSKVISMNMSNG